MVSQSPDLHTAEINLKVACGLREKFFKETLAFHENSLMANRKIAEANFAAAEKLVEHCFAQLMEARFQSFLGQLLPQTNESKPT